MLKEKRSRFSPGIFIFLKIILFIFFISFSVLSRNENVKTNNLTKDSSTTKKITRVILTIRNAPSYTVEFNAMYNYGVYELSGNYNGDFSSEQFIGGENFGVRHGIGGILTAKIPLHEQGNLRANISVSYINFSSKFNKTLNTTKEHEFAKYNVFSGIIGIENNFTPKYRIKTFVGIGITGSIIYGTAHILKDKIVQDLTILPAFRLGLSINSGLEYMLSNKFGFNCGIRFTHANLWLKESKTSSNPNEIYLNDKRTENRLPYSGFRQFAWGSFFAGINYYLGVTETEYIFTRK